MRIRSIIVRGTGRKTADPPEDAPFDFGIDRDWYEANKSKYPFHVGDYFTFGNPEGFGDVDNEEGREVDADESDGLYVSS